MTDNPTIDVHALVAAVERLLVEAPLGHEPLGAVNWGHLDVVDVEARISLLQKNAAAFYVVLVEEASPESGLGPWITERLDQERFPGVTVECAW